jgi:hypothetical protein
MRINRRQADGDRSGTFNSIRRRPPRFADGETGIENRTKYDIID